MFIPLECEELILLFSCSWRSFISVVYTWMDKKKILSTHLHDRSPISGCECRVSLMPERTEKRLNKLNKCPISGWILTDAHPSSSSSSLRSFVLPFASREQLLARDSRLSPSNSSFRDTSVAVATATEEPSLRFPPPPSTTAVTRPGRRARLPDTDLCSWSSCGGWRPGWGRCRTSSCGGACCTRP